MTKCYLPITVGGLTSLGSSHLILGLGSRIGARLLQYYSAKLFHSNKRSESDLISHLSMKLQQRIFDAKQALYPEYEFPTGNYVVMLHCKNVAGTETKCSFSFQDPSIENLDIDLLNKFFILTIWNCINAAMSLPHTATKDFQILGKCKQDISHIMNEIIITSEKTIVHKLDVYEYEINMIHVSFEIEDGMNTGLLFNQYFPPKGKIKNGK